MGSRPAARAAAGGRPRVTVREMSAVRFSFSRSINSRFFATNRSTRPVSRSRNVAMARCSASGGTSNLRTLPDDRTFCIDPVAASAGRPIEYSNRRLKERRIGANGQKLGMDLPDARRIALSHRATARSTSTSRRPLRNRQGSCICDQRLASYLCRHDFG